MTEPFIDLEVTNRCNAQCNFCPRDKMPKLGSMTDEVFERVLQRILDSETPYQISLTGFGDTTVHPQYLSYVKRLKDSGLSVNMTTNGHRLTEDVTCQLLEIGLDSVMFSVSNVGAQYDDIYKLDFETTKTNIKKFIELGKGKTGIQVSIVPTEDNRDQLEDMKNFWEQLGVDEVVFGSLTNRGGAMDFGWEEQFVYREEARQIFADNGLSTACALPVLGVFIDWKGDYYLCCQDWEKRMVIGNVEDMSIYEANTIKMNKVFDGNPICKSCSHDPLNHFSKIMYDCRHDITPRRMANIRLDMLKTGENDLQELLEPWVDAANKPN